MKNLKRRVYLVIGVALVAAFSLGQAEDKKTTKPPPRKVVTTATRPAGTGPAATGQTARPVYPAQRPVVGQRPAVGQPPAGPASGPSNVHTMDPNSGVPAGRRMHEPVTNTIPPNGAPPGTGTRPNGPVRNMPPNQPYPQSNGHVRPPAAVPVREWQGKSGSTAQFGTDGKLRQVSTRGMTIVHPPTGGRQIVSVRPDHSRIVTNGAGHGYVQAPFNFRGHEYARRTYYSQGHTYVNYYRSYSYHNVTLVEYTPVRYYSPVFYGWAYHPWAAPVYYTDWGWSGSPWYSYYGGYFQPYQSYPSAAFWLTDYIIAASLQASYQQQIDAQSQPSEPYQGDNGSLTPEVKQAIAAEVQRQLALENAEGQQASQNIEPDPNSSGLPRTLSDGASHVFIVVDPLNVSDSTGKSCVVSDGDVLQISGPPPQDATAGFLTVMASKDRDCPNGDVVTVAYSDLQDMQNEMRASLDAGLNQLQTQSGQDGLPPAPRGATIPPVQSAFAPIAPPPDPNVAFELSQQAGAADQAEQQVMNEAGSNGGQ